MKRRTGWRRDEKKLPSVSAARSTGSCRRAIWRAISGGTRASERIWSNRLLDDLDHEVVELAARGLQQLGAMGADQVGRHQAR